jgi:cellulose biosynthesis protein BcsQ
MENRNQILTIWGSPDAGKTTLSIKIAKELQTRKRSVAVILCDNETPTLPILMPNKKMERHSLGELLSKPRISQSEILKCSTPFGNNANIGLLGYCIDESPLSYPEYPTSTAKALISTLACLVDDVVVDCSSDLLENQLSIVALEAANVTLRVVNANLKSTVYMRSQRPLLSDPRFRFDQQIVVLNNILPEQDENAHSFIIGKADYVLPHCPAITEQFETGNLSEPAFGRESRHFNPVLKQLVKDVISDAEH